MTTDIRAGLPTVVKGGTTHKPIWTLEDGQTVKFVAPLNKAGLDASGKKPRLGKRMLGRYKAGVTVKGEDLMFVGVFSKAKE